MKIKSYIIIFLLFTLHCQAQNETAIIPMPVSIKMAEGGYVINAETGIDYPLEVKPAVEYFSNRIGAISGINLLTKKKKPSEIKIAIDSRKVKEHEGYSLTVTNKNIAIVANNYNGVIYAFQTILQTLPSIRTNEKLIVPAMEVKDYPRFRWRGMHLDVSRHFFSPETIKQYIDLLVMYKYNTFHWHLVDDHGWRIEIKKYPKLTSIGAWRADRYDIPFLESEPAKEGEIPTYGGFYTQEQIKEILEYANVRGITIVPEIELPGHAAAAIASYNFLSCKGTPQYMLPGAIQPADYQNVFCAGKDSVFTFLENVLTEVISLFPSKYIHIGGDEVNKSYWKECPKCAQRMKNEQLNSYEELQSYFTHRIEKFVNSKGRSIIGWDEILEGGLAPNAAVMSWRGEEGGITAAKMKHNVVMSPSTPLYFDYFQGEIDKEPAAHPGGKNMLKMVYDYNPMPMDINVEEQKYILGAQANVWTEFIKTREHLEYMILPRMAALSESVWSPDENKDWDTFLKRLKKHTRIYDNLGFRYRQLD